MALPALKPTAQQEPAAVKPAWSSFAGAPSGASAVGDMQRDLERRLLAEPVSSKWSNRRTLAFVVGTCGLFWAAVAVAVVSIV